MSSRGFAKRNANFQKMYIDNWKLSETDHKNGPLIARLMYSQLKRKSVLTNSRKRDKILVFTSIIE